MVKYATALRLGTAEAEQVLRRFTRGGPKHPTLRGLTALFWSNVNPYGTFRLDMNKRLDLGLRVPRPRTQADAADRSTMETR
jgi:hypothetical protein